MAAQILGLDVELGDEDLLGAADAVPADAACHTPTPGLHAIGDVTDWPDLTPVAMAEGRALADTLFGGQPH